MTRRPRRSEMVADATLVSRAAVRQALKNLVLVRALRDDADFDAAWFADAARAELEQLAAEADADATRVRGLRASAAHRRGRALAADDYRAADACRLRRRAHVLDDLAVELRRLAGDDDAISQLVAEARGNALDELAATTASVPGLGRTTPATGLARSRALHALREELSDYAD